MILKSKQASTGKEREEYERRKSNRRRRSACRSKEAHVKGIEERVPTVQQTVKVIESDLR